MVEKDVKAKIRRVLEPDFYIKEEVTGRFMPDGTGVRIDFMIAPKMPLIIKGFNDLLGGDAWIGIEAKGCPEDGKLDTGIQLAWQAVTYSMSEFGDMGRPPFILVCPPLWNFLQKLGGQSSELFTNFLQKSNVGMLEILDDKWTLKTNDGKVAYRMKFGSSVIYWDSRIGIGNCAHAAIKRNVGTWK
jgi:hypothetical protein